MSFFQHSVLNKHLKALNKEVVSAAYAKFKTYFHNPEIQQNIRDAKGDKIEEHKAEIYTLFGRASGYIKAHSHPEEQHAPPTMNDLKTDFNRFKEIEKEFNN